MIRPPPDIGDIDYRAAGNLALDAERPLVRARRLDVGVHYRVGRGRESRRLRQGVGRRGRRIERGQIRQPAPALAEALVDDGQSVTRQVGQHLRCQYEGVDAVISDAVVGADGGLSRRERVPCEAQRGPEVVQLVLKQAAGHPLNRIAGRPAGHHWLVGDQDVVCGCAGRKAEFPPQPRIHGQVGPHLPRVLPVELVFRVARVELERVLGPLAALVHEAAVDLPHPAQHEIDIGLEVGPVVGGVQIGRQPESGRVDGVDVGIEVHLFSRVQAGHRAALILLANAPQVEAKFEGVGAAEIRQVVHELPGAHHALVAEVILPGGIHRSGGDRDFVERGRLPENRVVAVLPDHKLVGDVRAGSESPVDGEVARPAQRVHQAGAPGEYRLAAVGDVAIAVIAPPDEAAIDRVPGVDHLVDLDGLIVLALRRQGREQIGRGVETIAALEIVGERLVLHLGENAGVETDVLRIAVGHIIGPDVHAGDVVGRYAEIAGPG